MSTQKIAPKKFTEQMIQRIRNPKEDGRKEISDAVVPGLVLRITPKGTKSFSVIYKVPGEGGVNKNGKLLSAKQHRITLGRWPILGLKEARKRARDLLEIVSEGKDPRTIVREQNYDRHKNTFAAVVERYIELYAKPNQTTWKNTEACFRLHVLPRWGKRPVREIRRSDIHELLDSLIQDDKLAIAREVRKHVRAMLNWAVEREIIDSSPANNIKRKELTYFNEVGRVLNDQELRAIWVGAQEMGYAYGPLFQLLILTGQRTSEWANASWAEINFEQNLLEIPAKRYKTRREHTMPISTPVLEILESLPRWTKGDYLFSARGASGSKPVTGFSKTIPRLERLANKALREQLKNPNAKLEHYQVKDFRKTCRTRLTQLGVSEDIAELVLGHTQTKIVRTYNRHSYLQEKREALEIYGKHIMEIVD